MSDFDAIRPLKSPWLPYIFAAALLHGALAVLLLIGRTSSAAPGPAATPQIIVFNLVPPAEGNTPVYMASANPDALPPEGSDEIPDAHLDPGGEFEAPPQEAQEQVSDADISEILAKEREALKAELEQLSETAMADVLPQTPLPIPPPKNGDAGGAAPGPEGAVRELDLDGYPQSVVDDIMNRYKLKVVTRRIEGGRRGQSFLSTASRGDSERYFGGMEVPSGVYEIFQLSRDSVALMSRLEEEALRAEGLEPLKSRVIRIVFGIVEDNESGYKLGVKSLEAEAVEQ